MAAMPFQKYRPFPPLPLPDRTWPGRTIHRAPAWCSVDLRDGNQALVDPMGLERKLRLFELLVRIGVKEIEVGFPASSQLEFDFVRLLIEQERIPEDVTIQVLTQSREPLIRRTFEALQGARRAVVHLYNSTSTLQRRVVFGMGRRAVVELALSGTNLIRELACQAPTDVLFQYSPESFTGTELDFALDICAAVADAWGPTPERRMIVNLPATVELATPNVYADQIEAFGRSFPGRDRIVLSVHPHNDRGTAVAAAELALLAGAERVEGALFGNGERTGNVDLVTLALNLFTQGVDPELDLSDLDEVVRTAEHCTRLPVHPRHPYAGELVFTAFSGSHQDAIRKGLAAQERSGRDRWEVPYLPLDPSDVGRTYEAVIRINSQSGKGGIGYVLEREAGLRLPRELEVEFAAAVQRLTDGTGEELAPKALAEAFEAEYLRAAPLTLLRSWTSPGPTPEEVTLSAVVVADGTERALSGHGNGPVDAFVEALRRGLGIELELTDFQEHALGRGAGAAAAAYVRVQAGTEQAFGVGRSPSIVTASLEALLSAVNRLDAVARRAAA